VVNSEKVANAIREIYYAVVPETSAAIKIFTGLKLAEDWLSRPLDQMV
jgi:hypothetical protein